MGAVIFNYGSMKLDLTCSMKDADTVIRIMGEHDIQFEKKFTTLGNGETPSTITFTGIFTQKARKDLAELITALNTQKNEIGNVYISMRGKKRPR